MLEFCPINTFDEFLKVIVRANKQQTTYSRAAEKGQVRYIFKYLKEISGDSYNLYVAVEEKYVSKDFLLDYADYYSLCFQAFDKFCVRLHFFRLKEGLQPAKEFVEGQITAGADNLDGRFWSSNYLGCAVIKPIPDSIFGPTVLRNYDYERPNPKREYWGTRTYTIHFFGLPIKVEMSLAFQEQDRNVAACATIAIWCVLQRAAEDYYINLRSPSQITKEAGTVGPNSSRLLPNSGLDVYAIAKIVSKLGMAPEYRSILDMDHVLDLNGFVKAFVRAYSRLKQPILLLLQIGDDYHAVAITGYTIDHASAGVLKAGMESKLLRIMAKENLVYQYSRLYSGRIGKLYVHDDGWGPFCRVIFDGYTKLSMTWNEERNVEVRAVGLMAPVFPKIRVAFEDIYVKTVFIEKWFKSVARFLYAPSIAQVITRASSLDIQLMESQEIKQIVCNEEVFSNEGSDRDVQLKFALISLPKSIWVLTWRIAEEVAFRAIFDTTALRGGKEFIECLFYSSRLQNDILKVLTLQAKDPKLKYEVEQGFNLSIEELIYIFGKIKV